jgi:ABC-type Fe3+/spermidine/putrescine transport system ATPase subunit/ABC-type spermidine/putrescine transport system permease subunit II
MVDWFSTSSHAGFSSASGNLQYLWPAALTSLELSGSAALLAVVLALPVAFAAVRYRGRAVTLLERATYLSFALPDLVAAIALAYAASHWAGELYGTFGLLVFAEAILFVPFAVVALRATLGQLEPALEDSARSLGSSRLASFRRVTVPLARPGLAAAAVLVFAFSLGDLSTAQVLLPLDRYTLGTEFDVNSSSVAFAAAAPFAAVLIGLALVGAYVVMSRCGRVRRLRDGVAVGGLRCAGVSKAYGRRQVLVDLDLEVEEGTLTAILGASGSGKTTLLRVLIGFIAADGGTVSIGGRTVAEAGRLHVPPDRRAVGYVAQEGALFPHLTVSENVGFGLPRSERRGGARIDEALELVGLDRSYAEREPQELSGGEQRRVALARALAPRPAVVLLDEPFSGLDASSRAETRAAVLGAMATAGATALLVTHDQAEALSMGHEVGLLRSGRLVQTAPETALYRAPADLDVARFVGEAVVVPGTNVARLRREPVRDASRRGGSHEAPSRS